MIRIRVLGATEITIGHRRIGMNTELLFALALYLTTRAGERVDREDLLERFWTQGSAEDRRHALRQLLYRLRQKGVNLDEDGEWVGIDAARVDSDVRDALADGWPEKADAAAIDAAAAFTPNFSRRIAPAFLEWLDGVRERLAAQHRRAALRQINVARREARWADLERWALPILRNDPLNEEATLARAESAAMAGSKTTALEILDNYLQEVGDISPELGKPAAQLRKRLAERRPDWATRGPKEVPLIGRTELMSRLTGLVEAAWRGDGGAVVLVGAPGIGKTRLAMEARAYAELKGMRTVVVRAEVGNSERPFALLQDLVAALLDLPGAAGCDPTSLEILRRLSESARTSGIDDADTAIRSARHLLPSALRELTSAVAHEVRALVVLDDLHNCDSSSAVCLRHLMISTAATRLSWIVTTRRGLRNVRATDELSDTVTTVRVSGLSEAESSELVSRTAAAHRLALTDLAIRGVVRASAGNPLFVRELSVARARTDGSTELPDDLQRLIADRLDRLSTVHLRLMRIVALLGGEATPSRLNQLSRVDTSLLAHSIESLEQDGLLSLSESRTFELHECWHRAILESCQGATRSALAFECASALVEESDEYTSPSTIWRAAELFRESGEFARALRLFVDASDRLFMAGFPQAAGEVIAQTTGLATAPNLRLLVLARSSRAALASADPESCVRVTDELDQLWSPIGELDRGNLAVAVSARTEALAKLRRPHDHELTLLAQLGNDAQLPAEHRQLLCATGIRLAASAINRKRQREFFEISSTISRSTGRSTLGSIVALVYHAENGSLDELRQAQDTALLTDADDLPTNARCLLLRTLGRSLRLARRIDDALRITRQAFELARARALPDDALLAAELAAYTLLDELDVDGAAQWIEVARAVEGRPEYAQRSIALRHATDRASLQRGDFDAVISSLLPRVDEVLADPNVISRTVVLAVLCSALAARSRREKLNELLPEALVGVDRMSGHQIGDFAVELVAQTLGAIGDISRSRSILRNHLELRDPGLRTLLPPYCQLLREELRKLSPDDGEVLSGSPNN